MVDVIVKPPEIETPHIDAIHGHTRIELKDVHTGKRERIESDNVVTDGIQYYLDTYDFWNKSSYITNIYSSNKKFNNAILDLFGGIFLFDKQIPETAQYMPAGTKMIGNGSYKVSNSSAVTELGSYNQTESVETNNSFIQVYDYTTAQANGEINSVCLATATGGFIGYGNSAAKSYKDYLVAPNSSSNSDDYYSFRVSGYSDSNTINDLATAVRPSFSQIKPSSSTNELKNISSITKDSVYDCLTSMQFINGATLYLPNRNCILVGYVQPSTKEVFILKKDYPKSKVLNLKVTKGFYNIDIYKQITIDELDSNKTYCCMLKPDGTKAIIFSWPSSGWKVNTTLNFIIYDIDNDTYTSHDVENNTGVNWNSSFIPIFPLANGNLIINWISKDNTSWGAVNIIDFVSNTTIKKLQMSDIPYARVYNDNLLEMQENLFYSPKGTMYDLVNKTAYPMNGYFSDDKVACCTPYVMDYYRTSISDYDRDEISLFPVCNPLRLMTINNLPSTITKTAAQTMKVTYTLTME